MSTFSCNNCGIDLSKYPSYEQSPCATCKLSKQYPTGKGMVTAAPDYDFDSLSDENSDFVNKLVLEDNSNEYDPINSDNPSVRVIAGIMLEKMGEVFAGCLLKMLRLAKKNPVMFEVIIKKIQFPYMSYSDIGESMTPIISKQNVLYHLKHAITEFPALADAFITDTRFSAGRNALETVANKERRKIASKRVKGILYGSDPATEALSMREINSILHTPFMIDDKILNYRFYGEDEAELRLARERERNRAELEAALKEGRKANIDDTDPLSD